MVWREITREHDRDTVAVFRLDPRRQRCVGVYAPFDAGIEIIELTRRHVKSLLWRSLLSDLRFAGRVKPNPGAYLNRVRTTPHHEAVRPQEAHTNVPWSEETAFRSEEIRAGHDGMRAGHA